ncbi:signal peptidase I [Nocardioides caeni]|uniref:Signal peptidase I n=1 Tax=Nocardioides caeni TaxID=574700 RepID=A0A4S8NB85_9ACTN|nr:signal peptidase I [Nocardioides caeni]THV13355.1 signal peptidase I [Nocardioides caeni]
MTTTTRIVRETFLWVAGALGALCLLVLAAGWLLNVTPLVFGSGSMSPAYEAGDLGVAREVPAASLEVGDVVSVPTSDGGLVTHRIVDVAPAGEQFLLTLQGDTNNVPDADRYLVSSADRVDLGIPHLGYVVNAATSPFGLVVATVVVLIALWLGFGRRDRTGPDAPRRARLLVPAGAVGAIVVGGLLGAGGQAPWAFTSAYWTDTASVRTTASVPVPLDTTPPVLSAPVPANNASGAGWAPVACTSRASQICVTATDTGGSGVATVFVKVVRNGNECWNGSVFVAGTACQPQQMTVVSGTQYATTGLTAAVMTAGTYQLTFTATDAAGNAATPLVSGFTLTAAPHAQPGCTNTGINGSARISFIDTSNGYQYRVEVRRADNNALTHMAILGSTTNVGQTVTYDVPDTSGGSGQNGNFNVIVQTQTTPGGVNVGTATTTPVHRDPLSGGNDWRAYCGAE